MPSSCMPNQQNVDAVELENNSLGMTASAWKVLTERGCPQGRQPKGMEFGWVRSTMSDSGRKAIANAVPGFFIPREAEGLLIRYQQMLDDIPRWVLRLEEPIERNDGKKQRRVSQAKSAQLPHPAAPWICPEVQQHLWAHAPLDENLTRLPSTETPRRVVIVEAPIKAWALTCAGLPAIGASGVAAGILDLYQPLPTLHPELQRYAWPGREVIVLYDANIHTNWSVACEAAKVAQAFARENVQVRIALLPRELGSRGPDDYLQLNGVESVRRVVDAAIPGNPLNSRVTADELNNTLYFRAAIHQGGELLCARVAKQKKLTIKAVRSLGEEPKKKQHIAVMFVRGDHSELARHLVESMTIEIEGKRVPPVFSDGQLYRYDTASGAWETSTDWRQSLSRRLQAMSGSPVSGNELRVNAQTVSGTIQNFMDLVHREHFFRDAQQGIAFRNGFARFDINGIHLEQHSPFHKARHYYDCDYEPGLVPRRFLGMLEYAFRGDMDAQQKVQRIREFVGICRLGLAPRYQQSLTFLGPRAEDGKSKIANVIRRSFPPATISDSSPWDLGNRFVETNLVGSFLNVSDDDRGTQMLDCASTLKDLITATEPRKCEPKGLPWFWYQPTAGFLMLVNALMRTDEKTNGFFRRQAVIEFNKQVEKDKIQVDIDIEVASEETQAIVCWTLEAAVHVLKRGGYTEVPSSRKLVQEWREHSDPVHAFVQQRCVVHSTCTERTRSKLTSLWQDYGRYCVLEGIDNKLHKNTLGERLRPYMHRTNGDRHYHLTLRPDAEDTSTNMCLNDQFEQEDPTTPPRDGPPSVTETARTGACEFAVVTTALAPAEPDLDSLSLEQLEALYDALPEHERTLR